MLEVRSTDTEPVRVGRGAARLLSIVTKHSLAKAPARGGRRDAGGNRLMGGGGREKENVVTHSCNPSYSGDRDQEGQVSKPAGANSSRDPILKKPFTKKGLVEWLKL
jgi:hypothetical protein